LQSSPTSRRRVRDLLQDQHEGGLGADHPRRLRLRAEDNRKKVTVVHKANVVRATDGLFLEIAQEVAKDFPEIVMDDANIDAMTMWLLKNPFNYDVLVAPNLYGDVISDLCAQMVGGLGFGASGNIGKKLAVFEPTHGSAPKYAGSTRSTRSPRSWPRR
jgi:isocitrate dehydrogenase (NAD+)